MSEVGALTLLCSDFPGGRWCCSACHNDTEGWGGGSHFGCVSLCGGEGANGREGHYFKDGLFADVCCEVAGWIESNAGEAQAVVSKLRERNDE
jgi:hypothetical protein